MGRIIVLDENTSNKIAAGEVVEKPASVVKELVENSIDAGAASISIDIRNGGISYIKITDNGSGMDEDDVELAFERHATSKIKKAEDLDSIVTMGFRGEALASIAAVSSVELQTKTANSTYGMYVHISGGVVKEVRQSGCPVGTTFIIKDLFYNTPARYKFLKKDSTEAGYISDTISRIALGNPEISFKLTSGKTLLLHTPGNNDLKSAIYSVYGKEIIKELMQVDYQDEKYKITGYIGKPEAARANRNYQSLYINKRYVKSKLVSYAVEQAYSSVLMKNKFPFFVLNIELSPLLVDANVHPAKTEVRFAEESYLSRAIYMAVTKAISGTSLFNPVIASNKDRELFKFKTPEKPEYVQEKLSYNLNVQEKPENNESNINRPEPDRLELNSFQSHRQETVKSFDKQPEAKKDPQEEIKLFTEALKPLARTDIDQLRSNPPPQISNNGSFSTDHSAVQEIELVTSTGITATDKFITEEKPEREYIAAASEITGHTEAPRPVQERTADELTEMKYIGQAFSTYIILQNGDELVMIDQHAAHERILYEKLKIKYEAQENITQLLLEPVVIQLQAFEMNAVKAKQEFFDKIGFVFEDFGNNSIIIRGIPYMADGYSPKEVFLELADKILESITPVSTPLADKILHTIACKAAIKANKRLNDSEVHKLLEELSNTGRRYTCPHGRPTVIRLTKYEIEKMFKRIV